MSRRWSPSFSAPSSPWPSARSSSSERRMSKTFGSRRLVVGAHYGMRDWLAQRITSVLMAIFTVAVVVQVLLPGPFDYYRWSAIFASQWMKVLTFVTIVSLLYHVWVGMRDIWMDYVKPV